MFSLKFFVVDGQDIQKISDVQHIRLMFHHSTANLRIFNEISAPPPFKKKEKGEKRKTCI